jgi:hypothetical protein
MCPWKIFWFYGNNWKLEYDRNMIQRVPRDKYEDTRRLGGPQGRSGRVWKISPPPEFDPRTVQPVAKFLYVEVGGIYSYHSVFENG